MFSSNSHRVIVDVKGQTFQVARDEAFNSNQYALLGNLTTPEMATVFNDLVAFATLKGLTPPAPVKRFADKLTAMKRIRGMVDMVASVLEPTVAAEPVVIADKPTRPAKVVPPVKPKATEPVKVVEASEVTEVNLKTLPPVKGAKSSESTIPFGGKKPWAVGERKYPDHLKITVLLADPGDKRVADRWHLYVSGETVVTTLERMIEFAAQKYPAKSRPQLKFMALDWLDADAGRSQKKPPRIKIG
jgi:hypothetical protein